MQENRQIEAEAQAPPIVEASPELQNFERVHGYDFIRLLGRGAQGETWLAKNNNGEQFAIKVYDMRAMQGWKDETLLRREVAALQQLNIDGVPKYYDFIEDLPKFYLVMEYISAPTLQTRIDSGRRPKIEDAQKLLLSLSEIFAELHSRLPPIIHRDIKPSNIMVDDNYNAWIVDFGVVASQDQNTFASTVVGSVGYMAPESMMGSPTAAIDIYSLGATVLYFITGKSPYSMGRDGLDIDYVPYLPQNLPVKFRKILDAMLAPSPKDRIASGQELLERISADDSKVKDSSIWDAKDACSLDASFYHETFFSDSNSSFKPEGLEIKKASGIIFYLVFLVLSIAGVSLFPGSFELSLLILFLMVSLVFLLVHAFKN